MTGPRSSLQRDVHGTSGPGLAGGVRAPHPQWRLVGRLTINVQQHPHTARARAAAKCMLLKEARDMVRPRASEHHAIGCDASSLVADAAHERLRVGHIPVELGATEVEARVLRLEALQHERLLHLRGCEGVVGRVAL